MKDETRGVAIEEFVGLTPKIVHSWQTTIVNIKKKKV